MNRLNNETMQYYCLVLVIWPVYRLYSDCIAIPSFGFSWRRHWPEPEVAYAMLHLHLHWASKSVASRARNSVHWLTYKTTLIDHKQPPRDGRVCYCDWVRLTRIQVVMWAVVWWSRSRSRPGWRCGRDEKECHVLAKLTHFHASMTSYTSAMEGRRRSRRVRPQVDWREWFWLSARYRTGLTAF